MSPIFFMVPRNGHIAEYFSECALGPPQPTPRDHGVRLGLTKAEHDELADEAGDLSVEDYVRHLLFDED